MRFQVALDVHQGYLLIGADYFGMGQSREPEGYMVKGSHQQATFDMLMASRAVLADLELDSDKLFRAQVGNIFLDYFLRLKRSEAGRFAQWLQDTGTAAGEEPTEWEQNEYFDFF